MNSLISMLVLALNIEPLFNVCNSDAESHCLLLTVLFHLGWRTCHFSPPLYTVSEVGDGNMMYILLIVSFTAQGRARHLIDSSLVWRGWKKNREDIHHCHLSLRHWRLRIMKKQQQQYGLKFKRWGTVIWRLASCILLFHFHPASYRSQNMQILLSASCTWLLMDTMYIQRMTYKLVWLSL